MSVASCDADFFLTEGEPKIHKERLYSWATRCDISILHAIQCAGDNGPLGIVSLQSICIGGQLFPGAFWNK